MKILLIAGIVFVVLGLALLGFYFWAQNRALDKDGMVYTPDPTDLSVPAVSSLEISSAGGELGGHESWEAQLLSGGRVAVTVTNQPTHSDREKVTRKVVDLALLEQITALVDARGMTDWDSLPPSDLIALDAPSTSVTFVYRGEEHLFSDSQELPDGGWAAVREIRDLIEAAAGLK